MLVLLVNFTLCIIPGLAWNLKIAFSGRGPAKLDLEQPIFWNWLQMHRSCAASQSLLQGEGDLGIGYWATCGVAFQYDVFPFPS